MKTVGVIPARLGSTRLKDKVLADLGGKPMIQHVYERAMKARLLDEVIVACDDESIRRVVRAFKGNVVLTSKDHQTGTDRLTEVVNERDVEIVVNIQGDEPFVHPLMIDDLVSLMRKSPKKEMATVIQKSRSQDEWRNPDVVKAVVDDRLRVLYFSRAPVPSLLKENDYFYKHIGLYAYTKDFLFVYKKYPQSYLERHERLEQLRALENGHRIWAVETPHETMGVDTAEDLEKARTLFHRSAAV